MIRCVGIVFGITGFLLFPGSIYAQSGVAADISGLQSVLDTIYSEMLPLCGSLIAVGQGIAGFAATWYIAVRVWRHIARAEPIDFYPLFRPFVLGFAVMIFPSVIAMINGALQPTVTATKGMVTNSDQAISVLLEQKQEAVQNTDFYKMYVGPEGTGDRDKWYQYTHPDDPSGSDEGIMESLGDDIKFEMAKMSYNFRNAIKEWLSEILQILYEAAALCINTIRSFYLIILAILGPLVFGLAVFDGFQHALSAWMARYINIFLWLPIANIFGTIIGKIQQNMIQLDINQVQANGDTFFSSTDTGYLIFLIIGIVGYFTIPSVAGYIIQTGAGDDLLRKTSHLFSSSAALTGSAASSGLDLIRDTISSKPDNRFFDHGYSGGKENNSPGIQPSAEGFLAKRISGHSEYDEINRRNT
jgi:conjugative transposon TraJ protein